MMSDSVDLSDLMDGGGTATRSTLGDKVPPPPKSSPPVGGATFSALMDKTFGKGHWRQTGGFRSVDREEELRAEGAGTVKPGRMSMHSVGNEDAPGARDVVVDGLTPDQAASKLKGAGVKFRHVFPEGTRGQQGAHLHIDTELADAPGEAVPTGPPPVRGPGPVDLSDLVDVGPKKPTPLAQAREQPHQYKPSPYLPNIADVPKDIGHQFMEGVRANQQEAKRPYGGFEDTPIPMIGASPRGVKVGLNTLSAIFSPISGAAEAVIGRPVANIGNAIKDKFHIEPKYEFDPEAIGNLASIAVGGAGELNEARAATKVGRTVQEFRAAQAARAAAPRALPQSNALKAQLAGRDPEYAKRVDELHRSGVELTPGQIKGGADKVKEDRATSSPYRGPAIEAARNRSIDQYNRATYDKVLAPVGKSYPKDAPVGHDAIAQIEPTLSRSYDDALTHARVNDTPEFTTKLADLRKEADRLKPDNRAQFEQVVNDDLLHEFPSGGMDGNAFKKVESKLSYESRRRMSSQDEDVRETGRMIGKLKNELHDQMIASSPPETVAKVQAADKSWAMFKRVQKATVKAGSKDGRFSPSNLLQAVKEGDKSKDKSQYAKGDALLQRWARAGQTVLPSTVPDSGTAGRMKQGIAGRVIGSSLGAAVGHHLGPLGAEAGAAAGFAAGEPIDNAVAGGTNALARALLARSSARMAGRPVAGRNAMRAIAPPVLVGAGAANAGGQIGNGQP